MDKIKKFLYNLPFRVSFFLYVTIFAFAAITLILSTIFLCRKAVNNIRASYPHDERPYYLLMPDGEKIEISSEAVVVWKDETTLSKEDKNKITVLNMITNLCVPIYSTLCLILAAMLFYKNKMKKPLVVLREAYQRISNHDLDFVTHYESKDEMGQLIKSFEKMRTTLLANNRQMWRLMEQRKQLNAAFAHDLRTPLTVLKGYSEILKNDSKEQDTRETASAMKKHIDRLERYADSMSSLQKQS